VSEPLYRDLEQAFTKQIELVDYNRFRSAVYRASKQLGLRSGGTHKARRFKVREFAGEVYRALRGQGLSSQEASANALEKANRKLGHSPGRKSTTLLYLGKRREGK
jgi:hypothetical protein